MKRIIMFTLLVCLMATSVYAIDICVTIPTASASRVRDAVLYLSPKPADFMGTDAQWIKEKIRRYLRDMVINAENKKAVDTANSTVLTDQDTLIQ